MTSADNAETLTLNRSGSDVFVDRLGNTVTSLIMYTTGETYQIQSNGSASWYVLMHDCDTDWKSTIGSADITPDSTPFGSVTNKDIQWRRLGDSMQVSGYFKSGTVTANPMSITMTSQFTIDTAKISGTYGRQQFGVLFISAGTNTNFGSNDLIGVVTVDPASPTQVFLSNSGGTTAALINKPNANTLSSNLGFSFEYTVPISGWFS